MRIAFYGNIANNFYQIVKALRTHSQMDAHLYLNMRDPIGMRPESDTPSLRDHYPKWIHQGNYLNRASMLFPWKSKLVEELRTYDVIIVSYLGPMFTQFIHRPSIFFVTGSDLTLFPFPKRYHFLHRTARAKVNAFLKGFWLRRGIRQVAEVWVQPYDPIIHALDQLSVEKKRISPLYFPLAIDTEKFKYRRNTRSKDENIHTILSNYNFTVFHPSRLMIHDDPRLKAAGQWKRNDLLFKGFAKFVKQSGASRPVLIMPDRTHSNNIEVGKEMIHKLGLEQNVLWIRPPRPEGFIRDELIQYYSIADVVTDEFGIGWFGSVVLEGLAMSRPVISYIDEKVIGQLYPWCPILSAVTEDTIAEHLTKLYRDPEYKEEVGRKGRHWVEEFHSGLATSMLYARYIQAFWNRSSSKV